MSEPNCDKHVSYDNDRNETAFGIPAVWKVERRRFWITDWISYVKCVIDYYRKRCDVRHLDVQLRKLQLPILPSAFIAEAARDLEVPIDSARHQNLLVLLRRLA